MTEVLTFDEERVHAFVRRVVAIAFVTGLVLALVSSGCIVLDRTLGLGSARFAFASSVIVVGMSALAMALGFRSRATTFTVDDQRTRVRSGVILVPQLAGVVVGILLVHLTLRCVSTSPWLDEHPRQFVNDVVATFGIVAVLHACAERALKLVPLAAGLTATTMYSATATLWHVDRPPHAFEIGVQELVLVQVTCVAIALLFLRFAKQSRG